MVLYVQLTYIELTLIPHTSVPTCVALKCKKCAWTVQQIWLRRARHLQKMCNADCDRCKSAVVCKSSGPDWGGMPQQQHLVLMQETVHGLHACCGLWNTGWQPDHPTRDPIHPAIHPSVFPKTPFAKLVACKSSHVHCYIHCPAFAEYCCTSIHATDRPL